MIKHGISIDLETLGLHNDAPIFAIGACRFNYDGSDWGIGQGQYFSMEVNPEGQGHPQVSNLFFWLQNDTRQLFASQYADPLDGVLLKLNEWFADFEGNIWIRGNKDSVWLESAYARHPGIKPPFRYNQFREVRTLIDFAQQVVPHDERLNRGFTLPERWEQEHEALDDARYQARCIQAVYKAFPIKE